MDQLNFKRFLVGHWLVEPDLNRIAAEGRDRKLEPRTMAVLTYLARHAGTVISRDELLEVVWSGAHVTENTLSRTISRLRNALGDDWQKPHYLETISKTGYRLIAPVRLEHPVHEHFPGDPILDVSKNVDRARGWGKISLALAAAGLLGFLAFALFQPRPTHVSPALIATPAVTLTGTQVHPVLSPDGQHVAFAWQGPEGDNWDIYVQTIGADNPIRLTRDPLIEVLPAWSPDSRYLAFLAGGETCGLFRVPINGGPAERMGECLPNIRHLNWSPHGRYLVYDAIHEDTGIQGIFRVDLETGQPELLTEPVPNSEGDWQPVYAPDGRELAFLRKESKDLHHIYAIPAEGGQPRRITAHSVGRIRGLDWTRDGRALVFSFNRDGRFALWRLPYKGGKPERLPITDDWVTYPSLARDAPSLIYKNYADVTGLWSISLDRSQKASGEPVPLMPSTRSELHPRISPDGRRLAFLSNRTGSFEVWSGDMEGGSLIRHTRLRGLVAGTVDWSPDGRTLIYDARHQGQSDLYLVDSHGRTSKPLTRTPWNEVNARFSPTSDWVYFASDESGDWQIWRRRLAQSDPQRITQEGGFLAQEGPEGRFLYFSRINEAGIFRIPVAGGEQERIWQGLGPMDWGNWQVCRDGLFYIQRGDNALMFQHVSEEKPREIFRATRTIPYLGPAFHVSADGRRLSLGQIIQSDDEVMIARLP